MKTNPFPSLPWLCWMLATTTLLGNPDWQELLGYQGTNIATLPIAAGPEFFRLARP